MPRLGLLPRRLHVWYCAAVVYLLIKATQRLLALRRRLRGTADAGDDPVERRCWSRTHTCCARRIVQVAIKRGALWLKFAQYCTSRADVLPDEYLAVLDRCLDSAAPMPPAVVSAAVRAELGGSDVHEVFDGFDATAPIASASIAQVHRCVLRASGAPVVLKVQRPGVRELLLQDLRDLDRILTLVAGAEPEFDFRPMLQAWMDMVPLECNFLAETASSNFVAAVLDDARGTEFATTAFVPAVLPEYTTERLMCIDYIDGCSIKEMGVLDSNGVDRDALVAEISKAFALQIHLLGKWSGDPHPGNILVQLERRNGASRKSAPWRPVLIDFGITVTLTDGQRLGFCRTVCAAAESDSFSLLQSFADMGIVLNRADPQASMDMIRHLFRSTASREDTRRQSKEFMERAKARDDASAESGIAVDRRDEPATERREARDGGRADENGSPPSSVLRRRHGKATTAPAANAGSPSTRRNPVDAYPGFLVFLFRTLGLLRGLSTRLGVEHAYLPIMYKVAQRALREAVPPSERMQSVVYPAAGGEWQPGSAASLESRRGKRLRKIVARVIVELERRELLIGCQVAAFVDGKIVLDVAAGRVGKHNARPVTPSTLFCCFSATKGVCAILFAELADEHGIDRDDLVGKWWPEFACKGKEATTVGMLLSHRAGLSTAAPEDMRMGRLRDDWQGIVDWLASDAKPSHPPGQRTAYHALNFGWLVAGLLQQVSGGESIQCRLNALAATLGIAGEAYIGLPKDLCRDVPTSRVAMLKSDIYADIARILKVRRRGRTSGGGESDGEAADAAHVQGENVDALYGNSSSAEANAMKFVFEEILTQGIDPRSGGGPQPRARDAPEAAGAAAAARTSAQPEGGDAGSATGAGLSDLFAKTPYLVDPAFFAHPVLREAVVPAANGHFSARALAKMYAVLAQDGVVDGKHVLRPGRAAKMMETERAPGAAADADESSDAFGAGVRVYNCLDRRGRKVSAKAMGHQGIGGSVAFCVPTSNFSVAFTCNQLNAFSVAGAVLISTVCAVLDVPTPAAYAGLMQKLRGDGVNSLEAALDSIDGEIEAALDRFDAPQMFTG